MAERKTIAEAIEEEEKKGKKANAQTLNSLRAVAALSDAPSTETKAAKKTSGTTSSSSSGTSTKKNKVYSYAVSTENGNQFYTGDDAQLAYDEAKARKKEARKNGTEANLENLLESAKEKQAAAEAEKKKKAVAAAAAKKQQTPASTAPASTAPVSKEPAKEEAPATKKSAAELKAEIQEKKQAALDRGSAKTTEEIKADKEATRATNLEKVSNAGYLPTIGLEKNVEAAKKDVVATVGARMAADDYFADVGKKDAAKKESAETAAIREAKNAAKDDKERIDLARELRMAQQDRGANDRWYAEKAEEKYLADLADEERIAARDREQNALPEKKDHLTDLGDWGRYDLDAAKKQSERLQEMIDEIETLSKADVINAQRAGGRGTRQNETATAAEYRAQQEKANVLRAKKAALDAEIKKAEEWRLYALIPEEKDFLTTAAKGKAEYLSGEHLPNDMAKTQYREYVAAGGDPESYAESVYGYFSGPMLDQYTEDEKNIYYYLYATDKERAEQFAWFANDRVATDQKAADYQKVYELAKKDPTTILPTAFNIAGAAVSGVDAIGNVLDYTLEGRIRPKLGVSGAVAASTEAVTEGKSDAQKFLYGTGVSILENTALIYTLGPLAGIPMALSSAADGMNDALERGATDEQAILYGVASGIAEAAFEKISIDKLITMKDSRTVRQAVENVLIQSGIEASEEAMTTIANTVSDAMIMGDKAKLALEYQKLLEQYPPEIAKEMAFKSWWKDVGLDALGGFISGEVMSGGKITYSHLTNRIVTTDQATRDRLGANVAETAGRLGEKMDASKADQLSAALQKAMAGKFVTNAEDKAIRDSRAAQIVFAQETGTEYNSGEVRAQKDIIKELTGIDPNAPTKLTEDFDTWNKRTSTEAENKKAPAGETVSTVSTESTEEQSRKAFAEKLGIKTGPTELKGDLQDWIKEQETAENGNKPQETAENGIKPQETANWRQTMTKEKAAQFDEAVALGERRGNKVIVTTEIPGEGRHDPDGTIYLNPNAKHPVREVLVHEFTHDIETSKVYERFSKAVLDIAEKIDGANIAQMKEQIRLEEPGLDDQGVERELVARFAGSRLFTDQNMVNRLFDTDQTVFRKIKNWISDALTKVFGSEERKELLQAEKLYLRAMNSRGQVDGAGEGQNFGGTEKNDYKNVVDLTDDPELAARIANSDKSRITVIRDYVFEMLGGEEITMSDGTKAIVDKSDAKHIANRARSNMQTAEVSGIREIIKKSQLYDAVEKATHDKYKGFRYYEIPVRYKGNVDFITVNVGLGKYDSKYHIYDLTKPEGRNEKRNTASRINGSGRPAGIALGNGVPADSIAQGTPTSQGLSRKNQQRDADYMAAVNSGDMETAQRMVDEAAKEAMPNTKVVDENGNPMRVYHQSESEFNKFMKGTRDGLSGHGIYFSYQKGGLGRGRVVRSFYINVENPITREILYAQREKLQEPIINGKWTRYEGQIKQTALYDNSEFDGVMIRRDEVVVKNPSQIKSADPVTYDDDGNVIPLSERFNEGNEDIRNFKGSSYEEMLDQQYRASEEKTPNEIIEGVQKNYRNGFDMRTQARTVLDLLSQKGKEREASAGKDEISGRTVLGEREASKAKTGRTEKSQRIQRRYERELREAVGNIFGVSGTDLKGEIKNIVAEMADTVRTGGKVTDDQYVRLLDEAKKAGYEEINLNRYGEYDDARATIKNTAIYLDRGTVDEIGGKDAVRELQRELFGTVRLTTDLNAKASGRAVSVDEIYQTMNGFSSEYFPEDVTSPTEQLDKIRDFMADTKKRRVGITEIYSGDSDYMTWAKQELVMAIQRLNKNMGAVAAYDSERTMLAEAKAKQFNPNANFEEARKATAGHELYEAEKAVEHIINHYTFTAADDLAVKNLLAGTITEESYLKNPSANPQGVLERYRAQKKYDRLNKPIRDFTEAIKEARNEEAREALKNSDFWKDKKLGLAYSTNTEERNIRDIIKDKNEAQRVIDTYFAPVHQNEAMKNRWIREVNDRIKDVIGDRHMNQYERAYTQMLGENASFLAEGKATKRKDDHEVILKLMDMLLTDHGKEIDVDLCERVAAEMMDIYNECYDRYNDEMIRNGRRVMGHIRDYFPHFSTRPNDTVAAKLLGLLGIETENSVLPTEIAGRTANRKPGTRFNRFTLERKGDTTDYDALKGFDMYISAMAENLYHTEDIGRLRTLATTLREKYSSENVASAIEQIRNDDSLTDVEKSSRIDGVFEQAKNDKYQLSNFAVHLDEYINGLAGKKSFGDREMEFEMGRTMYDVSKALEGRIAGGMVGYNLSTATMNLVPLFQATTDLRPDEILTGIFRTAQGNLKGDNFAAQSDFLTNRRSDGRSSVYQDNYTLRTAENFKEAMTKISDAGGLAMNFVDNVVSESLVRARVAQNLRHGMTEDQAFREADAWTAGLMADRSEGATPTIFNVKNPIAKTLTMFQIEQKNQWDHLIKDAGIYKWDDDKLGTLIGQVSFWLAMRVANLMYKKLFGRDNAVPDVIGLAKKDIDAIKNGKSVIEILEQTGKEILEQVPFVGGLIGGGRVPIRSALPDFEKIGNIAKGVEKNGWTEGTTWKVIDDVAAPLAYFLPGGSQIRKTGQGLAQILRGGNYGYDAEGNKYLKYLQDESLYRQIKEGKQKTVTGAANDLKTLLFGRWAGDNAKKYLEDGKSLTVDETGKLIDAIKIGTNSQDFFDYLMNAKSVKTDEGKRRLLLRDQNFTAGEKNRLDQILFPDKEFRDYQSTETFLYTGMTAKQQHAYDAGVSTEDFDSWNRLYSDLAGEGKQARFVEILDKNKDFTPKQKQAILEAAASTENSVFTGDTDWNDELYDAIGLTEKQKNDVRYIKAVSGKSQEKRMAALIEAGYDEELATKIVKADSWNDMEDGTAENYASTGLSDADQYRVYNIIQTTDSEEEIAAIAKELGISEAEAKVIRQKATGKYIDSIDQLNDARQKKLPKFEDYGFTAEEIVAGYNALYSCGNVDEKKAELRRAFSEMGYSGAKLDKKVADFYGINQNLKAYR